MGTHKSFPHISSCRSLLNLFVRGTDSQLQAAKFAQSLHF